jgi:hypothetical protein
MEETINQICSLEEITKEIVAEIKKTESVKLIPEYMNLLEKILPGIFEVNGKLEVFSNEDIMKILEDIVNAYENNDLVLMEDVLLNGLNEKLENLSRKMMKED